MLRKIPLVAFGAHINVQQLKTAEYYLANNVLTRSKLFRQFPKYVSTNPIEEEIVLIHKCCQGKLSQKTLRGIQVFYAEDCF